MSRVTLSRAERQLILLSAGTAIRRRATSDLALSLSTEVNWPQITKALLRRKLLPALGPRIVDLVGRQADDDFVVAVSRAVEVGRRQGAFLQLVSSGLMTALGDAGIRSFPLKGPSLGEAIYGDPGRRLSSDIDLLVPPYQLNAAVDVVRSLGYGAPKGYVRRGGLPLLHFALLHEQGTLPPVELHWRIHWYEEAFACERLLPPDTAKAGVWRPAPADELIALLLFYARDGFVDLRLAADVSAWWDIFGESVRSTAVSETLSAYPALIRAVRVAVSVAEQTVGIPSDQILGEGAELDVRDRIALRMANPNPRGSASQLYAEMGLVDGLLMPPGDLRPFIRREILLPREVLAEFDRRAPKRRARSSVGRGAGVLGRYALAMARLVRSPDRLT